MVWGRDPLSSCTQLQWGIILPVVVYRFFVNDWRLLRRGNRSVLMTHSVLCIGLMLYWNMQKNVAVWEACAGRQRMTDANNWDWRLLKILTSAKFPQLQCAARVLLKDGSPSLAWGSIFGWLISIEKIFIYLSFFYFYNIYLFVHRIDVQRSEWSLQNGQLTLHVLHDCNKTISNCYYRYNYFCRNTSNCWYIFIHKN